MNGAQEEIIIVYEDEHKSKSNQLKTPIDWLCDRWNNWILNK